MEVYMTYNIKSPEHLGIVIRTARKAKNLSQKDLAKLVGTPYSRISAIETGKLEEPGFYSVIKLLRLLDVELECKL
jgi:transcriptional regulator with XRE-family HTH domain